MKKKDKLLLAVIETLSTGGSVLIGSDLIGGDATLITSESAIFYLEFLYTSKLVGENAPLWFMRESEHYNAEYPCYTFVNKCGTYQVNMKLK